jgi:hypothetical protein
LEILMLWGKNKNVFVLFCNEPMPGQRWRPKLKTEDAIMCCLVKAIAHLTGQWHMSMEQWDNED